MDCQQLPVALRHSCRRWQVRPTRLLLIVSVGRQRMTLWEMIPPRPRLEFLNRGGRGGTGRVSKCEARNPKSALGCREGCFGFPAYSIRKRYVISTSRFGVGQELGSNQTPLGLHRVAEKIGAGWPIGAVFRARQWVGFTWQGWPSAAIAHRILWLEGLEPGFNRDGKVDTYRRYIYIHGLADEPSLGRPASHGCIHVAAGDLLPLFDRLPIGTLVWIQR